MEVVASEKISSDLQLRVITGDNDDLAEKLDIYLSDDHYAYLAYFKGKYLPTTIWGIDGEEDKEDMINTMRTQADWHRANPTLIGNTPITEVDKSEDDRNMDKCLMEWDDLVNTDQDPIDYL